MQQTCPLLWVSTLPTAWTAFRLSILGMSRRGADREQIRRAPIVHAGQMQSDSQSTQAPRMRNSCVLSRFRIPSQAGVVHRKAIQRMVNRVLTSPLLCYVVAEAAGGPAVHDV
jgi:hypothetical protein